MLSMSTAKAVAGHERRCRGGGELGQKALVKELRRDNLHRTELFVAKELKMSLGQLRRELTYEELWLWVRS